MFYWSNILNRKSFSDEWSQYLTWNFGIKNQIWPFLIHFAQLRVSLIKKSIMPNDFIDKNLYPVEWAKLSFTSVVILIMPYVIHFHAMIVFLDLYTFFDKFWSHFSWCLECHSLSSPDFLQGRPITKPRPQSSGFKIPTIRAFKKGITCFSTILGSL